MKILITGGTTFVSKYAAEYFVTKGNKYFYLLCSFCVDSQSKRVLYCLVPSIIFKNKNWLKVQCLCGFSINNIKKQRPM